MFKKLLSVLVFAAFVTSAVNAATGVAPGNAQAVPVVAQPAVPVVAQPAVPVANPAVPVEVKVESSYSSLNLLARWFPSLRNTNHNTDVILSQLVAFVMAIDFAAIRIEKNMYASDEDNALMSACESAWLNMTLHPVALIQFITETWGKSSKAKRYIIQAGLETGMLNLVVWYAAVKYGLVIYGFSGAKNAYDRLTSKKA